MRLTAFASNTAPAGPPSHLLRLILITFAVAWRKLYQGAYFFGDYASVY